MDSKLHPMDRDLADRFRRLADAEPWLTMALALTLSSPQWQAIRSGRVFAMMHQRLERAAATALRGRSDCAESAEDVAQQVICLLAEKKWLKRFVDSTGPAGAYLSGAMRHQTRDVIRALVRHKRRRAAALPDGLADARQREPDATASRNELMSVLQERLSRLPSDIRNAIERRYGLRDVCPEPEPPISRELVNCGITRLRFDI